MWGPRIDWEEWEASTGRTGLWSIDRIQPLMTEADRVMKVRQPTDDELTPWHRHVLQAAPRAGFSRLNDLNSLDNGAGVGVHKVNINNRLRWNMAFAFLDPIRDSPRLDILADSLVDRIIFEGTRCVGVEVLSAGQRQRIGAQEVILAAGTYGSPIVLLRSGVGPAEELKTHGIASVVNLPGVGKNLHDHPAAALRYEGTAAMRTEMIAFAQRDGLMREEGTTFLMRSSRCGPREPFDLHLYPVAARPHPGNQQQWTFVIAAAVMSPRSRGSITLAPGEQGCNPFSAPVIDTAFFSDPHGHDLDALIDGVEKARELASTEPLRGLIGSELSPGSIACSDRAALRQFLLTQGTHDYHPAGTCKMGPRGDPLAVCDERGKVHGTTGLWVADLSVAGAVPRANTNMPALVIALRIADMLLESTCQLSHLQGPGNIREKGMRLRSAL